MQKENIDEFKRECSLVNLFFNLSTPIKNLTNRSDDILPYRLERSYLESELVYFLIKKSSIITSNMNFEKNINAIFNNLIIDQVVFSIIVSLINKLEERLFIQDVFLDYKFNNDRYKFEIMIKYKGLLMSEINNGCEIINKLEPNIDEEGNKVFIIQTTDVFLKSYIHSHINETINGLIAQQENKENVCIHA